MQDSHIIYELLSTSLEQALHLTVTFGRHASSGKHLDDTRLKYEPEDVVVVAKGSDGRRGVVHVYGHCGVFNRVALGRSA